MSVGPDLRPEDRRRYESRRTTYNPRVMGFGLRWAANLPRLCKTRHVFCSQVPPGSYSETWLGCSLLGGGLGGWKPSPPRERCIANPFFLCWPFCCLPGVSQASISNTLAPCPPRVTPCMYYYHGERPRPAVRGACGGTEKNHGTNIPRFGAGPAPVRENRIQFPTHRPDVQDAQCCAQVGRFFDFFPHTRIAGSELGLS